MSRRGVRRSARLPAPGLMPQGAHSDKPIVEAPSVGMPEGTFLGCTAIGLFGHYSVNETQTAAGVAKQYVFKEDGITAGVRYVYVRNGVVNAIQR